VADGTLRLHWRETSARSIEPPSRHGFGSRLLQQTIVYELEGSLDMVYAKDGLHAVFAVPLAVNDRLPAST
jgi:two-component system CheB/CheR fusion protein